MNIAENIKNRRIELGLSQQQLADILGYKTRSTIAKIESGENIVSEMKLHAFAIALDTSVYELKYGRDTIAKEYNLGNSSVKVVVLAGGNKANNNQNVPNQFVNVMGKPVIIHTLETYQNHPAISEIIVVCLEGWEAIVQSYANRYRITKLKQIVPAGKSGILSAKKGIEAIQCNDDDIVVIQESTRPLITEEIVSKLVMSCNDAAVVCSKMDGFIQFEKKEEGLRYLERNSVFSIESPEAYKYFAIKEVFSKSSNKEHDFSETCCAMLMYKEGYPLSFVEGNGKNIKISSQEDVLILSGILMQNELR